LLFVVLVVVLPLLSAAHHVTRMLETNNYVRCLTIIDFSKAFDVVNHEVLLQKVSLLEFDLPDNIHNWLVSFITGRLQICKVNGVYSSCSGISLRMASFRDLVLGLLFT